MQMQHDKLPFRSALNSEIYAVSLQPRFFWTLFDPVFWGPSKVVDEVN